MELTREIRINGVHIQEYSWNGRRVVYVDNYKSELSYHEAIEHYSK